MARVAVRFLRRCGLYNGGEIAGFDDEQARKYVDCGAADYFVEAVDQSPVVKIAQQPDADKPKRGRKKKNAS